jgi:hypothetical protein
MLHLPNMLLIGGNARHAGKTSLACGIIRKFSGQFPVIGLKVTSIRPGEDDLHGNHPQPKSSDWEIFEEINPVGEKDTAQMLEAGAKKVFYIRASGEKIHEALEKLFEEIDNSGMIICESRSLRQFVRPGVFMLMIRDDMKEKGKDMNDYLPLADAICRQGYNKEALEELIRKIRITGKNWAIDSAKAI